MFGIFGYLKDMAKKAVIEGATEGVDELASGKTIASTEAAAAVDRLRSRLQISGGSPTVQVNVAVVNQLPAPEPMQIEEAKAVTVEADTPVPTKKKNKKAAG